MNTVTFLFLIALLLALWYLFRSPGPRTRRKQPDYPFPQKWQNTLTQKVAFYRALSTAEKQQFEYKIQEFLEDCEITGIDVEVTPTDKLLVASSAAIPVFAFPNWRYTNLDEVLLYPSSFNHDFESGKVDSDILGMVGTGYMERKMLLSKPALHHGFANDDDKKNTAIHEFAHLIDKLDGKIDGIPSLLLEQPYVLPWIELINQKIDAIYEKRSDINPYGGTSPIEFYAVASEYFFERPKLLERKHPKLYALLEEIFDQDMAERKIQMRRRPKKLGRNSPCPCKSGQKYKHCCGRP